ncbi:DUF3575 domain-containing protein [Flavobacterium sp. N3904]|uniref:DUF3575 domain-containing protein n=1 Tax=Flavobacterium sp. N3904 TaxID=2986835 RepID=UPI002224131F|nr:DUF3575 domain-containing protein [Flavobacterium sp. N3904]
MKNLIFVILIMLSIQIQSQTYIKTNIVSAFILVPNFGIETSIGKKSTFQFDVVASFWKSVNGVPKEFYTFTSEYRYHFKEKYSGFYAGANTGMTIYNFQKWNYLNTDKYEKGFGYFFGATIGYEKKISNHFMLDFFVGGGWHQGFYKGYYISSGDRYEKAVHLNKSGEWLPYRGGIMLSYKL